MSEPGCDNVKIGIVSTSDRASQGIYRDEGLPALEAWFTATLKNPITFEKRLIPDDRGGIEATLRELCDTHRCALVVTTGGTGPAPRDVTPEATLAVVERRVPGLAEVMRARSLAVTPHAMLSRAEAGIRGRCLIVNLPGSPKGAIECFHFIVPALEHAIQLIAGKDPDNPP